MYSIVRKNVDELFLYSLSYYSVGSVCNARHVIQFDRLEYIVNESGQHITPVCELTRVMLFSMINLHQKLHVRNSLINLFIMLFNHNKLIILETT